MADSSTAGWPRVEESTFFIEKGIGSDEAVFAQPADGMANAAGGFGGGELAGVGGKAKDINGNRVLASWPGEPGFWGGESGRNRVLVRAAKKPGFEEKTRFQR